MASPVETSGGLERQINVTINNEKMRLYDVTIAEIAAKLAQENIRVPAGQLSEGNTIYSLEPLVSSKISIRLKIPSSPFEMDGRYYLKM